MQQVPKGSIVSIQSDFKVKLFRLAVIVGLVVLLDQVTKAIVLNQMPLYRSITVIPGFFNLTHIQNPGGAFGFLADQSAHVRYIVFLFFSFLAIGVLFYLYLSTPSKEMVLATGFALILSGAIGNIIDRLRFGQVVDFLDFYVQNLHWPAFNIADSAIAVGIGIFIWQMIFQKKCEVPKV